LEKKEKQRLENRQSWEPIEKIKDLKKGYISQVVHKICELIIKYNAIVVFEDLNFGFKRGRQKIERQVYQNLEKALIEKLNYLVFKDRDCLSPGGVLNAYQLTAPFETFQKMGKQTGIIFYTQANYTSVTDPLSGFRKNIYISNSSPVEKIKKELKKLKEFAWDIKKGSYYLSYDQKDFNSDSDSKSWKIYFNVPRIRRENNSGHWNYKHINPNIELKKILSGYGFELKGDIKKQIAEKEEKGELRENREFDDKARNFYKSLIYLINLTFQLRNSFSKKIKLDENDSVIEEGKDVDFIASPVEPFFTTANDYKDLNLAGFEDKILAKDKERIMKEFNGDANGAYNIARKGLITLNRINENSEKPNLIIKKEDWDKFVIE